MKETIIGWGGILILNLVTYSVFIAYRISREAGLRFVWAFGGICCIVYIIYEIVDVFTVRTFISILKLISGTLIICVGIKVLQEFKKEKDMKELKIKSFLFEAIIVATLVFGPLFYCLIKDFKNIGTLRKILPIMGITNITVLVYSQFFSRYSHRKESMVIQIIFFIAIMILALLFLLKVFIY